MRVFDIAAGAPWAIREQNLKIILDIAQRAKTPDMEAVALKKTERGDGTVLELRGSVAVLNIIGPIFRYDNLIAQLVGGISVQTLARGLGVALEHPKIKSILLNIDSPGDELAGISNLSKTIIQARSHKPVWAYVGNIAASGAYWLASAAQKIVVADTSALGSIGVIATIRDDVAVQGGAKTYRFISSVSPFKRPDLETDEGRGTMQEMVDDLGHVFVNAVARNRGTTTENVIADFGRGFLRTAKKAVVVGMADKIGTFEGALASLQRTAQQWRTPAAAASAKTNARAPDLAALVLRAAERIAKEAQLIPKSEIREHCSVLIG
ncbi:MAG: S49 family peptidase [Acidobacteria bacterium]|nr:S49 family peptidase [Acidobacteriota bacterium]